MPIWNSNQALSSYVNTRKLNGMDYDNDIVDSQHCPIVTLSHHFALSRCVVVSFSVKFLLSTSTQTKFGIVERIFLGSFRFSKLCRFAFVRFQLLHLLRSVRFIQFDEKHTKTTRSSLSRFCSHFVSENHCSENKSRKTWKILILSKYFE